MPFGAALTTEADAVERRLEASYAKDMWLPGGQPAT